MTPGDDARVDTVLRIAADHARAAAFLVHDGVMPSNEGRGYVLRKIMRRALRNVRMIGVEDPFLYKMTGFVAELMQGPYPEMMESVQRVARVVKDEEHRYATTFLVAERVFNDAIKGLSGQGIPGALSFKLYDTYGLALDEQEEMAREHGLSIDRAAFEERDGAAARTRAGQLEGRGEGRGGAGVPGAGGAGSHEIPGLQRSGGHLARGRADCGQAAGGAGGGGHEGGTGAGPDAVLRGIGRPGGRSRRALLRRPARRWRMWRRPSRAFPG